MVKLLDRASPDVLDTRRAWIACLGAATMNGAAFGIVYTFGAFFSEIRAEFVAGSGPTALIFGIALLGFFGFGAVSGAWFERDFHLAEFPVIACHFAFALQDADEHGLLVRDSIGEHLSGLRRNGSVPRDDHIHEAAETFDA